MTKPMGYIIQDNQATAIYGYGSSVDEAWAMVIDGVGHFFDAYGNEISEDVAYATQFRAYGATGRLLALLDKDGGNITWTVHQGVADIYEGE